MNENQRGTALFTKTTSGTKNSRKMNGHQFRSRRTTKWAPFNIARMLKNLYSETGF